MPAHGIPEPAGAVRLRGQGACLGRTQRKEEKIMTHTQHTPGPWSICGQDYSQIISLPDIDAGKRLQYIARLLFHEPGKSDDKPYTDEQIGNARLIAAAPDLLAALQGMMAASYRDDP